MGCAHAGERRAVVPSSRELGPCRVGLRRDRAVPALRRNACELTPAACGDDYLCVYLCVAKKGYEAPTGLGTPNGTGAF